MYFKYSITFNEMDQPSFLCVESKPELSSFFIFSVFSVFVSQNVMLPRDFFLPHRLLMVHFGVSCQ